MNAKARRYRYLLALCALVLSGCSDSYVAYSHDGVLISQGKGKPGAERGAWTLRYFDGSLRARGNYDDQGRRTGIWETFFRNGQRESLGERSWVDEEYGSLRTGPWTFWHENGFQRSKGSYSNGRREGPWVFTKSDGSPDPKLSGWYRADLLTDPPPSPSPANQPSGSK